MPTLSFGVPDLMIRAHMMIDLQKAGFQVGANAAIFASMATEAFINDITLVLQKKPWLDDKQELIEAANLMPELEESKISIAVKYELLYYVLAHKALPKSELTWSNFVLLIKVRNAIAHYKSSEFEMLCEHPEGGYVGIQKKITDELKNKELIRKISPQKWTSLLDESELFAEWSIKAAQDIILLVCNQLPESGVKRVFDGLTGKGSSFIGDNRV